MESVYKVVVDTPYNSTNPSLTVGYVIGKEKAKKLKFLTIQKLKNVIGWQAKYKVLPNGEPGIFICKVCDLLNLDSV